MMTSYNMQNKIKTLKELNNKQKIKPVICILGVNGQLGKEFVNYLNKIEYKNFIGFDSSLDITNKKHIKKIKTVPCGDDGMMKYTDIVINCAAYNNVYIPENNKEEQTKCFKINSLGPKYLAEFCKKKKIKLIHFSTNYVFQDSRCTMKTYSVCGENFIKECLSDNSIIIRTSWLFSSEGTLIKMIKDYDKSGITIPIAGAVGNPTYTLDLVKQTLFLIDKKSNGLYHCVNGGNVTKKQYIDKIIELIGLKCITETTKLGPSMPLNNFMLEMEGLNIMRPWQEAIEDCFKS